MFLFDDLKKRKINVAIVSPIRQHIYQIDEKLKRRFHQSDEKKSKSHTSSVINNKQNEKRYQRMKFMGIPIPQTAHAQAKVSDADLKMIIAKVSQTSILSQELSNNESASRSKHANVRVLPEDVKLIPKIPECDYTIQQERERLQTDKFAPFSKAQPRGTNSKNLRIDKSLPWIEDELNATKAQHESKVVERKTFVHQNPKAFDVQSPRKIAENPSTIKKAYNEIISSKLQYYKATVDDAIDRTVENEDNGNIDEEVQSSVESTSSLSSAGTYFTNDSGSFMIELGAKIPKSQMNHQKKIQVSFFFRHLSLIIK